MSVSISKGDMLAGPFKEMTIGVHCANNIGVFGAGIAATIRTKYPHVNDAYVKWHEGIIPEPFDLGEIQLVKAEENFVICNLIGQKNVGIQNIDGEKLIPFKHESLREGFLRLRKAVRQYQNKNNVKIKIRSCLLGCGLAGSSIDKVYPIAVEVFKDELFDFEFVAFSDKDFSDLSAAHKGVT